MEKQDINKSKKEIIAPAVRTRIAYGSMSTTNMIDSAPIEIRDELSDLIEDHWTELFFNTGLYVFKTVYIPGTYPTNEGGLRRSKLYEKLCSLKEIDENGKGKSLIELTKVAGFKPQQDKNYQPLPIESLSIESIIYRGVNLPAERTVLAISWKDFLELDKPYYIERRVDNVILSKITQDDIDKAEKQQFEEWKRKDIPKGFG